MLRFDALFSANGSRNDLYSIPVRSIDFCLRRRCLLQILLWTVNLVVNHHLILRFKCFLGPLGILLIRLDIKVWIFVHNVLHDTGAIQIVSCHPIILRITVGRCYYLRSSIRFYGSTARISGYSSRLLRIPVWVCSRDALFALFS
jgi:hypothetical protein